jgi:4-amino-4-deoxy-L-arabinose transferase-like glycosyltransferase
LLGFLPWLAQIPRALFLAWQERNRDFSSGWLLACWFVVILGFFSISQSKLPGYIIPIFPALAMLVGYHLDRNLGSSDSSGLPWQLQTLFFAALGGIGFLFLGEVSKQARPDEIASYAQYTDWIVAALITLISFSLLAFAQSKRNSLASITCFAIGFFLCALIAGTGHETLGRAVSGADLVEKVKADIPEKANFYSVRILDHTVPFYLGRTMTMVEFPDELEFGVKQEPALWLPSLDAFIQRWKEDQTAYALMVPEQYLELQKLNLPMQEVGRDSRRVIVRHPDSVSTSP